MRKIVKFGVVLPVYGQEATWKSILKYAKATEKLGYDSIWIPDHILNPYLKERDVPDRFISDPHAFEAWTVLSALSTIVTKCRLGTYVTCNLFRHPSILAKIVSTLDVISGGRINLGIGACWNKNEFKSFGIPWKNYQTRLEMLEESITLIKRLTSEECVDFLGKYYQVKGARLEPKPAQKPSIPILIGGNSGEIMEIVAQVGDGWIPEGLTPSEFSEGVKFIKSTAKKLGRDPDKLMMTWGGGGARTIIAEKRSLVEKLAKNIVQVAGKPIERLQWIIGTPDECIEKIEEYIKAGAIMIITGFADFPSLNGLKLFSKKVASYFEAEKDN